MVAAVHTRADVFICARFGLVSKNTTTHGTPMGRPPVKTRQRRQPCVVCYRPQFPGCNCGTCHRDWCWTLARRMVDGYAVHREDLEGNA